MSQVAIKKVNDASKEALPVFDEFAKRSRELGHDLEDWLNAERELLGWPAAELAEKDGAYEIQITLPGFEAKDVEVTATPSEIVVHAATKVEKKAEKGNVLWAEFGSNGVYRRFEVPRPINVDKVTANLENGLLRINAPEIAKPKEAAAKAA